MRDRESLAQTAAQAGVVIAVVAAMWLLAPRLEALGFWREHFPWAHPREPLPFLGAFLLAGVVAGGLWPGTWESALAERSLRGIGWSFFLYWALGIVLESPASAGVAALPLIGGPAFATFLLARRAPPGALRPWLAALASVAGALGFLTLAVAAIEWTTRFVLLPLVVGVYVVLPVLLLRSVRESHEAQHGRDRPTADRPERPSSFFLDLPSGTLRPATTGLGIPVSIATVVFLVAVVAPGVPLSGPIAWVSVTLAIPVIAWAVLRREGLAHPRRLVAPPDVRVHHARVQHLRDQDLERLDDALLRFVRTGRGQHDLAAALAHVVGPSIPDASADALDALLARLPRAPWKRRAREEGVAQLVGGTALLEASRAEGRR